MTIWVLLSSVEHIVYLLWTWRHIYEDRFTKDCHLLSCKVQFSIKYVLSTWLGWPPSFRLYNKCPCKLNKEVFPRPLSLPNVFALGPIFLFIQECLLTVITIFMKELLDSDWLKALQFNGNTSVQSVTPAQITHRGLIWIMIG